MALQQQPLAGMDHLQRHEDSRLLEIALTNNAAIDVGVAIVVAVIRSVTK